MEKLPKGLTVEDSERQDKADGVMFEDSPE